MSGDGNTGRGKGKAWEATASQSLVYPEHEKLAAISEESQIIGEFLDSCGYTLCKIVSAGNNGEPKYVNPDGSDPSDAGGLRREWNPAYESWNDHYSPAGSIEHVLAEFFGIDRGALEREKGAMLAALRASAKHSPPKEPARGAKS